MVRAYSINSEAIAAERERVTGEPAEMDISRIITLDELELPRIGPSDVHIRILAVSAEHNVVHAALAEPTNVALIRGGKIFPGNSAVGEVLAIGSNVSQFKPGDIVITHCNGSADKYGYPLRIWAYDQPNSNGWYAEEAVVGDWQLIPAPLTCGLSLWEIAALPLRAPTAYHLWHRGYKLFRAKVSKKQLPTLNVLGFGGGVSELFLMLARSKDHRAFFCSGSPKRRAALEELGVVTIDQQAFNRFSCREDVHAFRKEVRRLTGGDRMHIVCDLMRGSVFNAGILATARLGVNISAGWQLNKNIEYDSASFAVNQITLDHCHFETIAGCIAATELYGSVFKPILHKEIYTFEHLPRAIQEMHQNTQTGIPIIRVADDMPEVVRRTML